VFGRSAIGSNGCGGTGGGRVDGCERAQRKRSADDSGL